MIDPQLRVVLNQDAQLWVPLKHQPLDRDVMQSRSTSGQLAGEVAHRQRRCPSWPASSGRYVLAGQACSLSLPCEGRCRAALLAFCTAECRSGRTTSHEGRYLLTHLKKVYLLIRVCPSMHPSLIGIHYISHVHTDGESTINFHEDWWCWISTSIWTSTWRSNPLNL